MYLIPFQEPFRQRFMLTVDLVHGRVYQVSLDTGVTRSLNLPLAERPTMALYDASNKFVYWTSAYRREILRSRIDFRDDVLLIYTSGKIFVYSYSIFVVYVYVNIYKYRGKY